MRYFVRSTHRYLSFFVSLQLLLWTISGIFFAFNKIELIRGEQYRLANPTHSMLGAVKIQDIFDAQSVLVTTRLGEVITIAQSPETKRYLNSEGEPLEKLTTSQAKDIVRNLTNLRPTSAAEITKMEAGAEFRGRALPLFRVRSEDDNNSQINVYLNAYSGEIVAIRSPSWRIWDLMWGLHIMDWQDREDIDNLLLKIFSILALISSLSGILLFFRVDFRRPKRQEG